MSQRQGLDPRGRQEVWDVITGSSDLGTTIFLTTQYLEEADRLAHRLAVIDHGRIVADGSADELKQRVASKRLDIELVDDTAYLAVAVELGRLVIHMHRPTHTVGVATSGSRSRRPGASRSHRPVARFASTASQCTPLRSTTCSC